MLPQLVNCCLCVSSAHREGILATSVDRPVAFVREFKPLRTQIFSVSAVNLRWPQDFVARVAREVLNAFGSGLPRAWKGRLCFRRQ